jgi:hypothetical protein
MAMAGVTMGMAMRVGMTVLMVIVRHSVSPGFDGDLYSGRIIEYYHSETAISSSTSGPPPTGNTMNCLPPAM